MLTLLFVVYIAISTYFLVYFCKEDAHYAPVAFFWVLFFVLISYTWPFWVGYAYWYDRRIKREIAITNELVEAEWRAKLEPKKERLERRKLRKRRSLNRSISV